MTTSNNENTLTYNIESIGTLYTRGSIEIAPSTEAERAEYIEELGAAVEVLNSVIGEDDWWMVGGISRDAQLNNTNFVVRSPDGGWRDVDIIVRQNNLGLLKQVEENYKGPLSVGGATLQSSVKIGEREAYLTFGRIRQEVPIKTFDKVITSLNGVAFPSVPLNTLFHLYAVGDRPGGRMREKDFLNALDIARYLKEHPNPHYPETLYSGFHEFSKRKNIAREEGTLLTLRDWVLWYINSPLNRVLPINNPEVKRLLLHVWDTLGVIRTSQTPNIDTQN